MFNPAQAGLPGFTGVPAIQLALAQWTSCAVVPGGNSIGDPSGPWPDLCGYAQRVYQPAFDLPTLQVSFVGQCSVFDIPKLRNCSVSMCRRWGREMSLVS